ncbi:MAG TPA: hypothetical protein PKA13_12015 [Geminicoccaceae bacterium]|nr:hypothetical protein [Geminicoccus sp.]HMU50492.1 hypothetical protein [Geminicoccaceae bacterium]
MTELLGWIRARLRADRTLKGLAILLLGVDLVLIWMHLQRFMLRRFGLTEHWLADDRFAFNNDTGLNMVWLSAQAVALAMAAALAAVRRPSPAVVLAALLTLAIAAAKLVKPHLALAEALAVHGHLHGWLGLNGRQLGKLVAEIGMGLAWLLVASISVRLAADGAGRTASALALWLVVALAVAGGLSDLGYMLFAGSFKGAVALFGLLEGAGEMLVLSVGLIGFSALARVLGRHRRRKRPAMARPPALPEDAPRCYIETSGEHPAGTDMDREKAIP